MPYISHRFFFPFLFIIIVFCGVSSCTDQDTVERESEIPSGYGRLTLSLPASIRMTRATEEGSTVEDQISNADLFIFKDSVLEKSVRNLEISVVEGKPVVTTLLESFGERNVYFIANASGAASLAALREGGSREKEFYTLLTDELAQAVVSPFIMTAQASDVKLAEGELTAIDLMPERLVSRLDIVTKEKEFVIESVALVNTPKQSAYFDFPANANIATFNTEVVPVEPASRATLYSYDYFPAASGKPLAIKVAGMLKEQPVEYTLDLKNEEGQPMSFNRNHIYRIELLPTVILPSRLTAKITVKSWTLSDTLQIELPSADSAFRIEEYRSGENTTTFASADSLFETAARGDNLSLSVFSSSEEPVEVRANVEWIVPAVSDVRSGISTWKLSIASNKTDSKREGIITLTNGRVSQHYRISQFDLKSDRYWVFAVAGQSNAMGWDESAKYPASGGMDEPTPGIYQLGLRDPDNLKILPLHASPQDLQNMNRIVDKNGYPGTKGIHLPLAQLLLKEVPTGYNVLVIPNAYGGAGFSTTATSPYDKIAMRATNLSEKTRWGVNEAYYRMLTDRVKHTLNANPDNKFVGVIWCQGEEEITRGPTNVQEHSTAFSTMAEAFFNEINGAGLANRCPRGKAGKHIWYNYDTTPYFYHTPANPQEGYGQAANAFKGSCLFGGYKVWNPDTFIHVPEDYALTNYVNGTGQSMVQRAGHYGNNAFRTTIAPMVVACMRENGGLTFDGSSPVGKSKRFVDRMTQIQAMASTGSLSGLQGGLMVYLPFDGRNSVAANQSPVAGGYNTSIINKGLNVVSVNDFPSTDGRTREGNALQLDAFANGQLSFALPGKTSASWTVSFLLKRTDYLSSNTALLQGGNGINNKLFIGFKSYMGESCGGNMEFVVEPSYTGNADNCGTGRLLNADKVRSHAEWIHYAVSFDASTKELIVYMNGQNVFQERRTAVGASDISQLIIGGGFQNGMLTTNGLLSELYLWDRVVSPQDIQKNYIMSYFGVKK